MVDGYLAEVGSVVFVPSEFLSWLRDKPTHALHAVFFDRSDEEMAAIAREAMVRRFISGLRVEVRDATPAIIEIGALVTREVPMYVSPVAGRSGGGGYVSMDINNPALRTELLQQGSAALTSWLGRFGDTAEASGVDVTPIRQIAAILSGGVALAVAAE